MIENENIEQDEQELSPEEELQLLADQIAFETKQQGKKTQEFIKRIKKGEKIPIEEEQQHASIWKMVRQLEKEYASLARIVYPKGSKQTSTSAGNPDLSNVKNMSGSIGSIIRKIG
jgi:hypothetical protein